MDRFDVQGERRFRDGFNPDKAKGRIYPNAGRSSRKIGACAKQTECRRGSDLLAIRRQGSIRRVP